MSRQILVLMPEGKPGEPGWGMYGTPLGPLPEGTHALVILGRELTIKNLLALLTRAELDCPMTPPGRSEPLGIALARKRATS